jgi:aminopeptidase
MTETSLDTNLRKYADLLVYIGVNITEGDLLHFTVDVTDDPNIRKLVHYTVESAYKAGAKFVDVNWRDEVVSKLRVLHAADESLSYVPSWFVKNVEAYADAGVARLVTFGRDPQLFAGLDGKKVTTMQRALQAATTPFIPKLIDENIWCGAAIATQPWADVVFPDLPADERVPALWDAIFAAARVTEDDPIAAWKSHQQDLIQRWKHLNAKQYTALHLKGDGTDLTIGLPQGHIWQGGGDDHSSGKRFAPNIPTEEIFTMPHRDRVNGTVKATKPLSYNGNIIDGFSVTFKDGRVVGFEAEQGGDVFQDLLDTDEGAKHLGEIALVPHSSPISQSGILFFNTLFDENAACHIALGRAYANTIAGGTDMDADQFMEAGGNTSQTHVDFMIGNHDVDIDGITLDGNREPVMRQGEWAF